ncbi:MAG: FAD-dependent oxidoreductase [Dokdonella sp.]|uniref:FAD-dependent oxidoreductase n=1 Tax=Dokdonella sp. TaxID=2291710 RepID=UPI00326702E9
MANEMLVEIGDRPASSAALNPRHDQTFPQLTSTEIGRLRRFGQQKSYKSGETLFNTGDHGPGMFIVLSGHVTITQRDGLGHISPVADQGPGHFVAEVGTLANGPALVDAHADGDVEAIHITGEKLRALLIAEAELGERVMRALILRRVGLIQGGTGGPVLIGAANSAGILHLQNFLIRNGLPHHLLDPDQPESRCLIARHAGSPDELPLVVCPDGSVLKNPTSADVARQIGLIGNPRQQSVYDVAIVGAGPAGLATAVYAASEGLSAIVVDARSYGGQAGASARIENYFGFPTGISGQALAGRAFVQAEKFGAEMLIPAEVKSLDCTRAEGAFTLELDVGEKISARAVVVASGARYRRPNIPDLSVFEGRGVWYWASPIEAKLCAGQDVVLVGGGNSAGQAAVFLSGHAKSVRMMVRSDGLAASMSRYLIDRIGATSNIELMTRTEIVALEGTADGGLERVRWRDHARAADEAGDIRNVFLFVGADPATGWLDGCGVSLDKGGFVVTGATINGRSASVSPLESSVPGVFAVGDVRSGSVKRVGGAIGEGAQVVQALHAYLAEVATLSS